MGKGSAWTHIKTFWSLNRSNGELWFSKIDGSSIHCIETENPVVDGALADKEFFYVDTAGDLYSMEHGGRYAVHSGEFKLESIAVETRGIKQKPSLVSVSSGSSIGICIDANGYIWKLENISSVGYLRDKAPKLHRIPRIENISAVSCGDYHCLLLGHKGALYAMGSNIYGQLGLGGIRETKKPQKLENLPEIIDISCADCHSLILTLEGVLYTFGNNHFGQLGLGDKDIRNRPKIVPKRTLPAIISEIFCAVKCSFLIDVDRRLWGFGDNSKGQFGKIGDCCVVPTLLDFTTAGIICHSTALFDTNIIFKDNNNVIWVTGSSWNWGTGTEFLLKHSADKNITHIMDPEMCNVKSARK